MKNYQQQRKQIIQLFQQIQTLSTQNNRKDIAKTLQEAAERFTEGKLIAVVAGEFKQGKSSLINALINEQDLFPVDIDITTNLVSTITYGREEKVSVVLEGQNKPKAITRAEIADYVTEQKNEGNRKKAQLLQIESPNPQLKEGLVLFDTPGVGGLSIEHTAISHAIVTNADVILFVSDSQKPYEIEELEFIKKIHRDCQNFLFIITKKDSGDYKSIVDSNREKLVKTIGWSEEQIKLIPVSSHNKLSYLKTKDKEDLDDSNFEALESELWHILEQQRGSILSLRALTDLKQALAQIKTPVEAEWNAFQQSPNELAEIEREFKQTKHRLQNLAKNQGRWQNKLNDGLQDIRDDISHSYQKGIDRICEQVEISLDDPQVLAKPESIVNDIQKEIILLSIDLSNRIGELASDLQKKIRHYTQLDISISPNTSIEDLEQQISSSYIEQIDENPLWEKSFNIAQNTFYRSSVGTSLGATIGGVLGGIVGSIFGGAGAVPGWHIGAGIGGFLGLLGGGATGVKQGLSNEKEKAKRQVSAVIKKFINQTKQEYFNHLNSIIKQIQRNFRDELITQIQQEKETCDRTLRSLKEAEKLTKEQTARKIAELEPLLKRIKYLEQQITQLAEQAIAQKEAASFTTPNEPPQKEQPESKPVTTVVGVTTSNIEDDEDWADG